MDEIYDMNLHDEIDIGKALTIIRVAGGWIYKSFTECGNGGWNVSSVFVPFNSEFIYKTINN